MKRAHDYDPRHSYDQIADVYDFDMGQNMSCDDVAYYVERALDKPERVLELGCGTGRITIPLLQAELMVTGADISFGMLSALTRRLKRGVTSQERNRLQLVQMDIRSWAFRGSFSTILCPYSLFTYLVESSDQRLFLCRIREQLCKNGQFIVDAFIPNSAIRYDTVLWDYKRALGNGQFLERSKLIEPTALSQVNIIRRMYSVVNESGKRLRTFTTADRIRCLYPEEMQTLVKQSGFDIVTTDWDYGAANTESGAHFVTFRCRAH